MYAAPRPPDRSHRAKPPRSPSLLLLRTPETDQERRSPQHEPRSDGIARVEHEAMLAGPERLALHLGHDRVADPLAHPRRERRADDRLVREHAPALEPPIRVEQRHA